VQGHVIRFRATLDDTVRTVCVARPDGEIEERTSRHVWDVLTQMLDNAITSLYELPPRSVREQLANLARIVSHLDEKAVDTVLVPSRLAVAPALVVSTSSELLHLGRTGI
jgi:hypothetical protein